MSSLSDPNPGTRTVALDQLVESHTASHEVKLKALVDALSDPDWLVRANAAEHIAASGVHDAVSSVRKQLALEHHPTALASLIEAISEIGDSSDVPRLWDLANSEDRAVRGYAFAALGEFGGRTDLDRMQKMPIEDGLPGAALLIAPVSARRSDVARYLGRLGDEYFRECRVSRT